MAMIRKLIPMLILMAFLSAVCTPVFAEEKSAKQKAEKLPWDKFTINLGAFISSTDSNIRLSAKGLGVDIDVEEALGVDATTTVFRANGFWRFSDNRRHRAELSWFALRRDGSTTLGQDITIDGVTYPTGTEVKTTFDVDVYKASYSYSFFQDERMDIGAGLGLYIMPMRFKFNANGLLSGQVSENVTAPLPVFDLRADFALTPKWFINSSIDLFYLEYGQFRGALFGTKLGVNYKAFKHIGFGLGIENFNLGVEAEGEDYPEIDLVGQIHYRYFGAMLYATFYF
jgi:hypothetical protein